MFQIKICGITTPADALLAAKLGADAIGLNFYEKSPRYLSQDQAAAIDTALGLKPVRIGVFVNANREAIFNCAARVTATCVQLHGDESPDFVAELRRDFDLMSRSQAELAKAEPWHHRWLGKFTDPSDLKSFRVIRAFRRRDSDLNAVKEYLELCSKHGGLPHAVLLDAHQPGSYGGTGQTLDWTSIRDQRDKLLGLPLILAGGLTPDNVAQAILTARPDAVDVASGVESSPGKKDPSKLRDFLAAAKEAFAKLSEPKE
ncbi:MAG TPA: phosphoribosylanthranilate isomerase [Pirellulaceae bacterium]|jgi:phosphoribosylanthranilate isomerase